MTINEFKVKYCDNTSNQTNDWTGTNPYNPWPMTTLPNGYSPSNQPYTPTFSPLTNNDLEVAQLRRDLEVQANEIRQLRELQRILEKAFDKLTEMLDKPGAKIVYDTGTIEEPLRKIEMDL